MLSSKKQPGTMYVKKKVPGLESGDVWSDGFLAKKKLYFESSPP